MPCEDWSTLLQRYRSAAKEYHQAVENLTAEPGPKFNESWHRAEAARTEVGLARADLLNHEHDHACLNDKTAKPEAVFQPTEEWVLGDQGQPGG